MTDTPIRSTVSALTQYLFNNLPGNLTNSAPSSLTILQLQSLLNTYVSLYSTAALPLTAVQPDYESNVAELQTILNSSEDPAWNVTTQASTGQAIVRMIATAQTFNQFSVERALQETMLDFAQLPSSIYTIARMQGVKIARRQPANCSITLTLTAPQLVTVVVPAYSNFSFNNFDFYNRQAITFPPGSTSQTLTVYQGTISTLNYVSDGQAYQSYSLGSADFSISDADIQCLVGSTQYTSTESVAFYARGLWEYGPNDAVFYSSTDAAGNAQIVFGDGTYGLIPTVNTAIQFTYAETVGAAGNVDSTGNIFSYDQLVGTNILTLAGVVNSPATGGLNERNPNEYAVIAPAAYSAKLRPSTLSDYNVFALNYPNGSITDAYFEGQQQFAPNNLNFMMVVRVTLLSIGTIDFQDFVTWITPYSGANIQFIPNASQPVPINVTATVYCTDTVPLATLQSLIEANLQNLFTPRAGFLGYSIYQSDIVAAITSSDNNGNIQFVQLLLPSIDYVFNNYQYATLGTVSLNMIVSNRKLAT